MKTTRLYYLGVSGIALACAACGASKPSSELMTARNVYTEARNGETAQLNPTGVHEAYKALQAAEAAHEDDAGSAQERHRAYIAARKAELAIAEASEALATKEQQRAEQTYQQTLEQQSSQLAQQTEQLQQQSQQVAQQSSQYQEQLTETQQELQERDARLQEMQTQAQQAQQELQRLESFRQEAGRTVISLPGVMFKVGEAELSPLAERRLDTIARALQAYPEGEIAIEGYTDARGAEEKNLELSEQRASAVRQYLERQGISGDRLRVEGRGEANPIATNATAEGRAYNRRVEIVVDQQMAGRQQGSERMRQNVSGTDDETETPPRQQQPQQQPQQGQPTDQPSQ